MMKIMSTKAMSKELTGVSFTAKEFRILKQCLRCGKASDIPKESLCIDCTVANLPQCEMCDIVLRKGLNNFYSYNTKDRYLEEESYLKPNTRPVKEFCTTRYPFYPQVTDLLCSGCINWEKGVKNECWNCQKGFTNNKENYKLNGNLCANCVPIFELNYDEEIIYN